MMNADEGETGPPKEDPGLGLVERIAGVVLNEEDERVFFLWRENIALQDPRVNNKALNLLVRAAMADDQIRSQLVNDTEGILDELRPKFVMPEDATIKFYDNARDTLHVVLPPRASDY
jgi:hypothetical protein